MPPRIANARVPASGAPSAIDFLHRHDAAATLLPSVERLVALSRDLKAALPPSLRAACEASAFDAGTLVLRASSPSAAAKLRQTLPRLREALLARGWRVDALRLRLRPAGTARDDVADVPPRRLDMPRPGVDAFAALAARLDEATPLRAAVERLVARRDPRR